MIVSSVILGYYYVTTSSIKDYSQVALDRPIQNCEFIIQNKRSSLGGLALSNSIYNILSSCCTTLTLGSFGHIHKIRRA
ncbi:MAG: hypothetical protein ACJ71P_13665 [Nitrososphaeraceae archaeon]